MELRNELDKFWDWAPIGRVDYIFNNKDLSGEWQDMYSNWSDIWRSAQLAIKVYNETNSYEILQNILEAIGIDTTGRIIDLYFNEISDIDNFILNACQTNHIYTLISLVSYIRDNELMNTGFDVLMNIFNKTTNRSLISPLLYAMQNYSKSKTIEITNYIIKSDQIYDARLIEEAQYVLNMCKAKN